MTEEEARPLWMKESRRLIDELKPLLERAKGLLSDLENQNQLLGRPDWWRQMQKQSGENVYSAKECVESAASIVEYHDQRLDEVEGLCQARMTKDARMYECHRAPGHDGDHQCVKGWWWNEKEGVKP